MSCSCGVFARLIRTPYTNVGATRSASGAAPIICFTSAVGDPCARQVHRAELNEDWELCRALGTPKPISPPEVSVMIAWNVTALKVLPGHRLEVAFAGGLRGIVDMSKDDFSGVFAPLVDESYFALATIHDGVVVWPNGVDIAPDAMYDEVSGRHLGL
jgi:hypothetical protein